MTEAILCVSVFSLGIKMDKNVSISQFKTESFALKHLDFPKQIFSWSI